MPYPHILRSSSVINIPTFYIDKTPVTNDEWAPRSSLSYLATHSYSHSRKRRLITPVILTVNPESHSSLSRQSFLKSFETETLSSAQIRGVSQPHALEASLRPELAEALGWRNATAGWEGQAAGDLGQLRRRAVVLCGARYRVSPLPLPPSLSLRLSLSLSLSLSFSLSLSLSLSLSDGQSHCVAPGKRLPHSAEWQLAAQGVDGRRWPWCALLLHSLPLTALIQVLYAGKSSTSPRSCASNSFLKLLCILKFYCTVGA